jgi:endonuclease YncB( thermonuclease family)
VLCDINIGKIVLFCFVFFLKKNTHFFLSLFLLFFFNVNKKYIMAAYEIYISAVVDGNNVELTDGNIVRLYGIDAPELEQIGGVEARDKLHSIVFYEEIARVFIKKMTIYGKTKENENNIARLSVLWCNDIGLALIMNGFAHAYRFKNDNSTIKKYKRAEDEAIRLRFGLWSNTFPTPQYPRGHRNFVRAKEQHQKKQQRR